MKYNHVLALNPYYKDSTSVVGLFPPTGIEYIATSMKNLVGKITLMDLRHEKEFQDINNLNEFIRKEIDLLCISVTWNFNFKEICELICKLPDDIPVVVGGIRLLKRWNISSTDAPLLMLLCAVKAMRQLRK